MQIFSFIASEFGVRFTDIHQPKRKKHSPIFTCTYSIFHFESIIHFEIVFLDFQIYQHKFTCLFSYHFKSLISVVSSSLLQLCTCFFLFFPLPISSKFAYVIFLYRKPAFIFLVNYSCFLLPNLFTASCFINLSLYFLFHCTFSSLN